MELGANCKEEAACWAELLKSRQGTVPLETALVAELGPGWILGIPGLRFAAWRWQEGA